MRTRALAAAVCVIAAGLVALSGPAEPAVLTGFSDDLVAGGIPAPTAVDFTPDARILVATQGGLVRVIENGALLPTPALDLTAQICSNSERGVLGVAVDPLFGTSNSYVFLYYSFKTTPTAAPPPSTECRGS